MAYVIFLQALSGAIAGSHHPGREAGGLDALFVLCTSEGMQTSDTAQRIPEKPNGPANNCCGWGCGSVPVALDQPPRGDFVSAWGVMPFRTANFTIDETASPPRQIATRSNPVRGSPFLRT